MLREISLAEATSKTALNAWLVWTLEPVELDIVCYEPHDLIDVWYSE
jgi:hypothetical protein